MVQTTIGVDDSTRDRFANEKPDDVRTHDEWLDMLLDGFDRAKANTRRDSSLANDALYHQSARMQHKARKFVWGGEYDIPLDERETKYILAWIRNERAGLNVQYYAVGEISNTERKMLDFAQEKLDERASEQGLIDESEVGPVDGGEV